LQLLIARAYFQCSSTQLLIIFDGALSGCHIYLFLIFFYDDKNILIEFYICYFCYYSVFSFLGPLYNTALYVSLLSFLQPLLSELRGFIPSYQCVPLGFFHSIALLIFVR